MRKRIRNPIRIYKMTALGFKSGKSSFIASLMEYRSCWPSAEDIFTMTDAYRKDFIQHDGTPALLEVMDFLSSDFVDYPELRYYILRDTQAVILLYSVTSRESFERVVYFHETFQMVRGWQKSIPMVVVGSKCDREDEREVSPQEGRALAESLGYPFYEVSALHGDTVKQPVLDLVQEIRSRSDKVENENEEQEEKKVESRRRSGFMSLPQAARDWIGTQVDRVKRGI